uniref:HTH myb-type domain-containing protein n=1 Tax=Kalanchoe fedtschenkoi TaxID=63787 RepID=A0A7N0V924_KALFE
MEKMQQLDDKYAQALELERKKMLMFERELPLSIELVSLAIELQRKRLLSSSVDAGAGGGIHQQHRSDQSSSEETTSDCGRVLEFIPLKKPTCASSSESGEHQQDLNQKDGRSGVDEISGNSGQKSDWLRSVQLWNQTPDLPPNKELGRAGSDAAGKKVTSRDGEEACKPLNEEKSVEKSHRQTNESSTSDTKESQKNGGSRKEDKEGSSQRKQRRSWSQDLHRRFLHSLQQLGGAHVATPKQIRELMKVDGLTNDEVKSHLQKYRLHTRRPTPPPSRNNACNGQAPQFVVLGGIWVPQSDYTTMAVAAEREAKVARGVPRTGVYTPMAAPPAQPHHPWQQIQFNQKPQTKSKNSEGNGGDGLARCISPSMSSTTRATPSPVC